MSAVPPEAVAAAMAELDSWQKDDGKTFDPRRVVQKLLTAAEPAMARAERERIRKIAITHGATYDKTRPCSCGRNKPDGRPCTVLIQSGVRFADLLATL